MTNTLTQPQRELLDQVLDQLIPANPDRRIPSAGRFGVGAFVTAQAGDDDRTFSALNKLLSSESLRGERVTAEMVRQLEAEDGENFTMLLSLTYKGYYSRPEIRSLLGIGGWPVHPRGHDVPSESAELIDALTTPVRERGSMYRDPDDEHQAVDR